MYCLQSRYYNSEWGRFINGDTLVGSVGDSLALNAFKPVFAVAGGCEIEPGPGTEAGLVIAGVAAIAAVGIEAYNTDTYKSKTTIATLEAQKPKVKYFIADCNRLRKRIDIGEPITQIEAQARGASNSILCADDKSTYLIAIRFPCPKMEMNEETFGEEVYYLHYHINGGHGDPYIWF